MHEQENISLTNKFSYLCLLLEETAFSATSSLTLFFGINMLTSMFLLVHISATTLRTGQSQKKTDSEKNEI